MFKLTHGSISIGGGLTGDKTHVVRISTEIP